MPIKKYSHDQNELQLGQNLCTQFDFIQQNDDPNQSVDFYANILYYVDTKYSLSCIKNLSHNGIGKLPIMSYRIILANSNILYIR